MFKHLRAQAEAAATFKTPGFYGLVRHPLMTGFIIAFWATPTMTQGHLLFAAVTTPSAPRTRVEKLLRSYGSQLSRGLDAIAETAQFPDHLGGPSLRPRPADLRTTFLVPHALM